MKNSVVSLNVPSAFPSKMETVSEQSTRKACLSLGTSASQVLHSEYGPTRLGRVANYNGLGLL
jgi:hypothetical protein